MNMRVTQGTEQLQFLSSVQSLEQQLDQTQNDLSSNESFTTASQNPVAAGEVDQYNQALSQSTQYSSNAQAAQTNLQTEDSTLSQVQTQLQSLYTLTLEANSGTETTGDKAGIASQIQQIQQNLLGLANATNGNGEYIFAGYATTTQPFSLTATGATYSGDNGVRQQQIAAGQTVADSDNGNTVFNNIKTGNGTFAVAASTANTGSALVGASTVVDPATYDGGSYTIKFSDASDYQVLDANNNVVSTGTYTDGGSIAFKGVQVTLSGTPAANDSFAVTPSSNQSIFTTVQNVLSALSGSSATSSTTFSNSISGSLANIQQAITQMSNVRASVGGRENTITTQLSVATSQQTQLQTNISNLQGLDYASAITSLDQENTTLSAALQAYTMTQGLSLFKYLS